VNLLELAARAARIAARLRADMGFEAGDALCPYDLCERLGVTVRLIGAPSLEGMYAPSPHPTIMINAERPPGRRRYTCGHELGHHVFAHDFRLDDLIDLIEGTSKQSWSAEEYIADRFSAGLLMPKLAVESAFARRGWAISSPRSEEVYVVAHDLGVGYATLVGHIERTLKCVSSSTADALRKVSLPRIRQKVSGFRVARDLIVADEYWGRRPIDIEVGDIVVLSAEATFEGTCATYKQCPLVHIEATSAGKGFVRLSSFRPTVEVRVSRQGFTGLARYRHLEDGPDGE
jgi:hypothetical protein